MTAHLHPTTGLPYFGHDSDWQKVLPAELQPSQRSTTSSRTPGRINAGTIWHAVRKAEACPACGTIAGNFPGAHSPHFASPGQVVDCVGRPCAKDAEGYYQVVTP